MPSKALQDGGLGSIGITKWFRILSLFPKQKKSTPPKLESGNERECGIVFRVKIQHVTCHLSHVTENSPLKPNHTLQRVHLQGA